MREKIFANEDHKNNYKKLMKHIDKGCHESERIQAMVYELPQIVRTVQKSTLR